MVAIFESAQAISQRVGIDCTFRDKTANHRFSMDQDTLVDFALEVQVATHKSRRLGGLPHRSVKRRLLPWGRLK